MRASFIRHGESTANAGIPTPDYTLIELTERGWRQAREIAASWTESPALIVTSPYLRARQSALPTIDRFPDAPVEIWPIQEFTYLSPDCWNGTSRADRQPYADAYWKKADPEYQDGAGAESFANLLRRAETTLTKLEAISPLSPIFLFTHGHFMQAIRDTITYPQWTDKQKMERFASHSQRSPIFNGQKIQAAFDSPHWRPVETSTGS